MRVGTSSHESSTGRCGTTSRTVEPRSAGVLAIVCRVTWPKRECSSWPGRATARSQREFLMRGDHEGWQCRVVIFPAATSTDRMRCPRGLYAPESRPPTTPRRRDDLARRSRTCSGAVKPVARTVARYRDYVRPRPALERRPPRPGRAPRALHTLRHRQQPPGHHHAQDKQASPGSRSTTCATSATTTPPDERKAALP